MNETTPQGTNQPFGAGFFAWIRGLGMVRGNERWFAGVAGGIAAKANIDPIIVRGIFVVLAVLGGPGILLYLAGWLLLPDFTGKIHVEEIFRGRASATAIIVGILVVVPIAFALLSPWSWNNWGIWNSAGLPGWISVTLQVLVWIAVFVGIALLVSRLIVSHGRKVNSEQPFTAAQPTATAPPAAAPSADASAADAAPGAMPYAMPADAPSAAPGPAPDWAENAATSAGEWGKNFSEQATAWSQNVSEKATAWGNDVGKQADAWSARYAEHHDAHKIGAAHTVLSIAVALLAAGCGAFWAWNQSLSSANVVTLALISAVAVLAVSLIIAGVRGKHTGWVGFLAFCSAVALIFTSFVPGGSQFQPFGNLTVSEPSPGAVLIAGNSDIELGALDDIDARHDMTVWQVAGNARVQLPSEHPVIVKVFVLAGNIVAPTGPNGEQRKTAGPFLSRTITTDPDAADASVIKVYLIAGNVRVSDVAASNDESATDAERTLNAEPKKAQAELERDLAELRAEMKQLEQEMAR